MHQISEMNQNLPVDKDGVVQISITNIGKASPTELAVYISRRLLNSYVPVAAPNQPLIITADTANLLGDFANRLSFATELWSMARADLGRWKNKKRRATKEEKPDVDEKVENLNAKVDMLYRVVQSLQNKYDATSRQVTILDTRTNH